MRTKNAFFFFLSPFRNGRRRDRRPSLNLLSPVPSPQPFLPNHPALASFFPSPTTAVSLAHAAGGAIAVGTLAYCGAVMVGAAVLKDTPGYVPPALQAGRGTKKRE
jgi:hypothetical protein